jgi:hypothetical protein
VAAALPAGQGRRRAALGLASARFFRLGVRHRRVGKPCVHKAVDRLNSRLEWEPRHCRMPARTISHCSASLWRDTCSCSDRCAAFTSARIPAWTTCGRLRHAVMILRRSGGKSSSGGEVEVVGTTVGTSPGGASRISRRGCSLWESRTGLENRRRRKASASSNLAPSASPTRTSDKSLTTVHRSRRGGC